MGTNYKLICRIVFSSFSLISILFCYFHWENQLELRGDYIEQLLIEKYYDVQIAIEENQNSKAFLSNKFDQTRIDEKVDLILVNSFDGSAVNVGEKHVPYYDNFWSISPKNTYVNDNNELVLARWVHFNDGENGYTLVAEKKILKIFFDELIPFIFCGFIIIAGFIISEFAIKMFSKLHKERNRFDDLMSLVDESCLISETDKNNNIIRANKKFCETSGWKFQKLLGKNHRVVNSGTHSDEFWDEMYNVTDKGGIWNDIVHNKGKGGIDYWVDSYIKKKTYEDGHMSIRHDITELVKEKDMIARHNKIMDRSAYMIRHDLKNPLTIIDRYFKKMDSKVNEDVLSKHKILGSYNVVKKGLEQLLTVYNGIYDFTSMVRQGTKINKEVINISNSLQKFFSNNTTSYANNVIIGDDMGVLEVNKGLFCNAIDNLVRNGLHYNESKSKWVKIYKRNNDIIIEDNGIGMTHDQFLRMKEPNIRGNTGKSGTGLGLSITEIIVETHGWYLDCENSEYGTKMVIKNVYK